MSSVYALPEPLHYVDSTAAAQYEANTGSEIAVPQTVHAPVDAVFDAWYQHIWLAGGTLVAQGEGRGLLNHRRRIHGLNIEEQLLSVGFPSADDSNAVASVLYVVTDAAGMPIANKLALVRFIAKSAQQTEIVWTIKITPTPEAVDKLPGLLALVKQRLETGLAQFAKAVDASVAAAKM